MFHISYIKAQADCIGRCLQESATKGYDSEYFAKILMTSSYGIMVMTDKRMIEYSDFNFMLEGFERETRLRLGKTYNKDVLWLAGYIYKYWVSTRQVNPRDIYRIAPLSLINNRYMFYHTQDIDYIIDDIISRPFKKS